MQFKDLSTATANILSLCDEIGFGALTNLDVIDGQIHTTQATRKQTRVNLDKAPAQPASRQEHDYTLNASQERLVREARRRGTGRILSLDIREGRPANVNFEEVVPAI